jgi:hypothetical protein
VLAGLEAFFIDPQILDRLGLTATQPALDGKAFEQQREARMPCRSRCLSDFHPVLHALTTRQPGDKDRLERHGIQMAPLLLNGMIVDVSCLAAYRTLDLLAGNR